MSSSSVSVASVVLTGGNGGARSRSRERKEQVLNVQCREKYQIHAQMPNLDMQGEKAQRKKKEKPKI